LRVPWTSRRSNQSIQKEINPAYSLEGLMLELKLQYFGYLMQRADSLAKILMLRKIEGRAEEGPGRRHFTGQRWQNLGPSLNYHIISQSSIFRFMN